MTRIAEATSNPAGLGRLDVLIVGGGPAGLSAALVAGRARLQTLIVNDERPRNRVTKASHGFFTRDGAHAYDLLAAGKRDLEAYDSVTYVKGVVETVAKTQQGFSATLADGRTVQSNRIVLAMGHRDDLAGTGIPNLAEVYGVTAFPCPFCDGWEHRDEEAAVIGHVNVEHLVPMVRTWTRDVMLFTNGVMLPSQTREAMERNGVAVREDPIDQLVHHDGHLQGIQLGGQVIPRQVAFVSGAFSTPKASFADDLGIWRQEHPWGLIVYKADDFGRTNIPGAYVVGDAHHGFARLLAAATEGARCLEMIVGEIAMEKWT